jgi:hypothetical protein
VPLQFGVIVATVVSRIVEPCSIYDARLAGEEIAARSKLREPSPE